MKFLLKTDKETILKLLKDTDINRKIKILNRLGDLPDSDRIKVLLKILEDSSWYLREQATIELAKAGSKVVPRLIKLCRRGFWFTRAAACRTLGEIGDINALDTVVDLLVNDTNPTVIKEVKNALIKIAEKNRETFMEKLKEVLLSRALNESQFLILKGCLPQWAEALQEVYLKRKDNG
ncbi:MAG: HEAT repeat domain-containing protein [candidate division WOR-3 bacterium]